MKIFSHHCTNCKKFTDHFIKIQSRKRGVKLQCSTCGKETRWINFQRLKEKINPLENLNCECCGKQADLISNTQVLCKKCSHNRQGKKSFTKLSFFLLTLSLIFFLGNISMTSAITCPKGWVYVQNPESNISEDMICTTQQALDKFNNPTIIENNSIYLNETLQIQQQEESESLILLLYICAFLFFMFLIIFIIHSEKFGGGSF